MRSRIYIVLGIASVVATSISGCTNERERGSRFIAPQLTEQELEARTQAVEALAARLMRPAPTPTPPPPPEAPFQNCLIDTKSCMALDPRPFALCPAVAGPADKSVCNGKGGILPLDSKEGAAATTDTRNAAQPLPEPGK